MQRLGYGPHITLAVYETIDPKLLTDSMDEVFKSASAVVMTFDRIRIFDGEKPVLWAAPKNTGAIDRWANVLHKLIDPDLCHPHYRPGVWQPHCTLATDIRPEYCDAARNFAKRRISPFEVTFDFAECVEFPPVRSIRSKMLCDGC